MFVYELSGRGFESRCCHLNFRYGACLEQGVPWQTIECRFALKLAYDMIITKSQKICALHRRSFQKDRFFTTFYLFSQYLCNISNKYDLPKIYEHINIFTQETLLRLLFRKKMALSIANVFWNIHFLPHFHYF